MSTIDIMFIRFKLYIANIMGLVFAYTISQCYEHIIVSMVLCYSIQEEAYDINCIKQATIMINSCFKHIVRSSSSNYYENICFYMNIWHKLLPKLYNDVQLFSIQTTESE